MKQKRTAPTIDISLPQPSPLKRPRYRASISPTEYVVVPHYRKHIWYHRTQCRSSLAVATFLNRPRTASRWCHDHLSPSNVRPAVHTNDDINWDELREELESVSKIDGDHRVPFTNSKQIGYVNFNGRSEMLNRWWGMLTRKISFDVNHRLKRACNHKLCIVHWNLERKNIASVCDMDADDVLRAYHKLESSSVLQANGCRLWTGCVARPSGYGQLSVCGLKRLVHVLSWELAHSQDTDANMVIRHLCGNKLCIEGAHLVQGTRRENALDAIAHGTMRRGEQHPMTKITRAQAQQVVDTYCTAHSQNERATMIGVSVGTVKSIDSGGSWQHLLTPEQKRSMERRKRAHITVDLARRVKESRIPQSSNQAKHKDAARRAALFGLPIARVHAIDHGVQWKDANLSPEQYEKKQQEKAARYDDLTRARIRANIDITVDEKTQSIEHWLWNRALGVGGYGSMTYRGHTHRVHVIAYQLFNGKIPDGYVVRHKCVYKHCCAPNCLEIGTHVQNALDKHRDGSVMSGERNKRAQLSDKQARELKASVGEATVAERAQRFNVSKSTVWYIDSGKTWRHITTTVPILSNMKS